MRRNTNAGLILVGGVAVAGVIAGVLAGAGRAEPRPAPGAAAATVKQAAMPDAWSARERLGAAAIGESAIAAHTRFLSSDLLEGRAPGSRGDELAMAYVAAELERIGLQPGAKNADGSPSWFDRFDLVGLTSHLTAPPRAVGRRAAEPLALVPAKELVVAPGRQVSEARLDGAEVVFVGYGIDAPEQKWDDFKGTDLRGKVLLIMNSDPAHDDEPALFAGKTRLYYGRWTYKFEEAARLGAAGAIVIHTTPSAGYPWQVVETSWNREEFELPIVAGEPRVDVRMWITDEAAHRLVRLGDRDLDELRKLAERRDFKPVPLGVKLSLALATDVRHVPTANVLGRLEGSDEALRNEALLVTAHHDHLGVRPATNPPSPGAGAALPGAPASADIFHGALDNASGVAAMLTLAEGLARLSPAPARSVIFAAVAAEESGLIGSQHLAAHPPLPPGRIACDINLDGIDIFGPTRDLVLVGRGKSPEIDAAVTRVATEQHRVVVDNPFPDRGSFYRSDQLSLARVGVPAIFLKAGTDVIGRPAGWGRAQAEGYERSRYHQPSDVIDATWDLAGAVVDTQLLLVAAARIADAKALPRFAPGDEFAATRDAALAAARKAP